MLKTSVIFFLFLCFVGVSAQTVISGTLSLEEDTWEQKIYLGKVSLEEETTIVKEVTWSPITKNGSFSFQRKHISDKDAVYRLYVNPVAKVINDTILKQQDFISSKKDRIFFSKGLDANYKSSSAADAEWQKMLQYEEKIDKQKRVLSEVEIAVEDTISEAYAAKLKSYTKDSLKILLVKLIGIQQLAKKGLLDKDINENKSYYLDFLSQLKESDMQAAEYQFLSRRLAYLTQDVIVQKYQWSKTINALLGIFISGLLFFIYRLKRKQKVVLAHLSKQEKNIQILILQGKSNKEIANELFISLSTVKTHITNIYSKLKVSNRKELWERYSG